MYPEIVESAAQLREVLADRVEPWPWLTWSRRDAWDVSVVQSGTVPEPRVVPLPVWVNFSADYMDSHGVVPVGFLGSDTPHTEAPGGELNLTSPYTLREPREPIAAEPTDLLYERAVALFGRPTGAMTPTLGGAVALMDAAHVLRRIAERCGEELPRWDGQRVVTRKLSSEATTYTAVADQFDAAAFDSTRFWWADFRARAIAEAEAEADGGPVVEPIAIRLN